MKPSYLVTGGAGFIGSHLSEALLDGGANVTVLDDLSTGRWENIAHLDSRPGFHAVIASADERQLIREEVQRHSFVYHLASAVGVQLVVDKPVETVQRIVRCTDVIIEECARFRRPFLLSSTSEVYGKSENIPFREEDDVVMGPSGKRRWAYAAAKVLDEFLVLAHHHQSSLPVFIVRLFNTVGPRQSGRYGMVLPRFVEAAMKNEPLRVFGEGTQKRCFCSVFDVVRGLIKAKDSPAAIGKVINLGSTQEVSINELAEKVIAICGSKSKIVHVPYEDAYGPGFDDMRRRVPSLERAAELLSWKPEISLDEIIRQLCGK